LATAVSLPIAPGKFIRFFENFVNVLESPADLEAMRQVGRLIQWKDEQGFGFITPKGGGDPVFVHVKSFSNRQQRPLRNDLVRYTVVFDGKDRAHAEDVEFVVDAGPESVTSAKGPGILALAVFFLLFVVNSVREGKLPFAVLGLYLMASSLAFVFYKRDKAMAITHQRKIPENTLHLWSLIGGWPGAALAEKLVHHKSRKRSFQIVYWITIALNGIVFFWMLSPRGSAHLRSFLNGLGLR
jgi:uncharacterized membrane protein YsdA (DUF1294 family)/cold shock CspA family protein